MLVLKDVKFIENPSNSPYIKNCLKVKSFILDNLFKVESVDDYIYIYLFIYWYGSFCKGKESHWTTDTVINQLCKYKLLRQESNDVFIEGSFNLIRFPSFNILELITQREADILEETPCFTLNSSGIIDMETYELWMDKPYLPNKPKHPFSKEHWRVSILENDLKTEELIEKTYKVFLGK